MAIPVLLVRHGGDLLFMFRRNTCINRHFLLIIIAGIKVKHVLAFFRIRRSFVGFEIGKIHFIPVITEDIPVHSAADLFLLK